MPEKKSDAGKSESVEEKELMHTTEKKFTTALFIRVK